MTKTAYPDKKNMTPSKQATRKVMWRRAGCGTVGLPVELACEKCKYNISQSTIKGRPPKLLKKCTKPWDEKWKTHREEQKVQMYHKVKDYLVDRLIEKDIKLSNITSTLLSGLMTSS